MSLEDRVIQYASSGDTHIAYAVIGDGPIDLVWSSAGATNVEGLDGPYMKEGVERLSSFSRLITFDHRGTGLSDPVPLQATPTLEERMDDIRAVLDAAGSEQAILLGQGYGGPTAILFAGTYPARVSFLVLYATYARWLRDDDYPEGMPADATARYQDAVRSVWGTGGTIQAWAPSLMHDEAARRV